MLRHVVFSLVCAVEAVSAANTLCKGGLPATVAAKIAGYPPASSYCRSKYPIPATTSTSTAPTTTITATADAVTITTTIATVQTTTFYSTDIDIEVDTITETATQTVGVQYPKRDLDNGLEKRKTTLTTSTTKASTATAQAAVNGVAAPAWGSAIKQANNFVASVCTCLQTQSTLTVVVTPSTTTTTTPQVTQFATEIDVVSAIAESTITIETTTTATVTATSVSTCNGPMPTFYLKSSSGAGAGKYLYQDNGVGYLNTFSDGPGTLFFLDSNSNLHSTAYGNPYGIVGDTTTGTKAGGIYFQGAGASPAQYRRYGIICALDANTPTVQGVPKNVLCAVNGDGGNQWFKCPDDGPDNAFGITLQVSDPGSGCSAMTVQAVPACSL